MSAPTEVTGRAWRGRVFPQAFFPLVEVQEEMAADLERVAVGTEGKVSYQIALVGSRSLDSVAFYVASARDLRP